MILLFLLLLLVVPYLVLTLLGKWMPGLQMAAPTRARVGMSLLFVFTGVGHFIRTEEMTALLPASVPNRVWIIYLTGILELLGGIGIWIAPLMKLTGFLLILFLLGVLPANVYSAVNLVDFGGHQAGPIYLLVRVPFQLFVIWWTYFATEQNWFQREAKP